MANLSEVKRFNFTVFTITIEGFTITIEGFDQLIFRSDGYLSKMPPLGLVYYYY